MNLQKAPLGLLGAFALKVTGRNPYAFGDGVMPVVEVLDQYLATSELLVDAVTANVNLATFNSANFIVPNGKVWRLIGGGASFGPNAADNAIIRQITLSITGPASANAVTLGASSRDTAAPGSSFGIAFRPPIFLPAGWKVSLNLLASGPWTVAVPFPSQILRQEFDL